MTEEFSEFSELGTESGETVKEDLIIESINQDTVAPPQNNLRRVVEFLESYLVPVGPGWIAHETGVKLSNVKNILRVLRQEGRVTRPHRGLYLIFPPHGGGLIISGVGVSGNDFSHFQNSDDGVRFQNVDVVSTNVLSREVVSGDDVVLNIGDIRVVVMFGSKYNRVSWRLSCSRGVDYRCLMLVKLLVESNLRGLGYGDVYVWEYPQHEKLQDGLSISESQDSLTVDSCEGVLWKAYNKPGGITRREVKVTRPVSAEALEAAYYGDVAGFRVADRVSAIEDDLRGIHEALRVLNGGVSTLIALEKGRSRGA